MYILRLVAGRDPNGCRVYILRLMVGRDPNGCSVHILRLVVGRDPPRWMHILLVSQVHGEPGYRRVRVYILRLVVGRDTDPFVCAYNGYWWAGIPTRSCIHTTAIGGPGYRRPDVVERGPEGGRWRYRITVDEKTGSSSEIGVTPDPGGGR